MPKMVFNCNALVFSKEDKYFVIQAPSMEAAEKIVELWNGGNK